MTDDTVPNFMRNPTRTLDGMIRRETAAACPRPWLRLRLAALLEGPDATPLVTVDGLDAEGTGFFQELIPDHLSELVLARIGAWRTLDAHGIEQPDDKIDWPLGYEIVMSDGDWRNLKRQSSMPAERRRMRLLSLNPPPEMLSMDTRDPAVMRARIQALNEAQGIDEPLPDVATLNEVAAFEAGHGVTLPAEFVRLVTEVDGGFLKNDAFDDCDPDLFEGLPRISHPFPAEEVFDGPIAHLVDGILIIANRGCGDCRALVVSGAARGSVWAWGDGYCLPHPQGQDALSWFASSLAECEQTVLGYEREAAARRSAPSADIWKTQAGERIPIPEMKDGHLRNTLTYLRRHHAQYRGDLTMLRLRTDAVDAMAVDDVLGCCLPAWRPLLAEARRRGMEPPA